MDLLDDVFAAMRVSSALHSRLQPSAPWGIRFIRTPSIRFGFMLQGEGWLQVEGHPPQRLQAGGGFIVKPDRQSALFDHAGTPLRWCEEVFADCQGHCVAFGGGGEAAELLCGWLTFNPRGAEPLLSLLPDYVVIPADSQRSPLLAASLQLLELETRDTHLGSRLVVSRLADVLFVQALRAHYQQVEPRQGWVAALADKRLRPVMQRLHEDLAHPWRLTTLAQLAGMSRSSFAAHFRQVTGETPGEYLTRWRMYRARCLLAHPDLTLEAVAQRVGYDSAITFGRAFKRAEGRTAGEYRRALNP